MSAAFDTVDHDILLGILESEFGIKHMIESWFSTYLRDRVTKVSVDGDFLNDHVMRYSLPQGSIIGPHGFILYYIPPLLAISCVLLISLSTHMLMIYNSSAECNKVVSDIFDKFEFLMKYQNKGLYAHFA